MLATKLRGRFILPGKSWPSPNDTTDRDEWVKWGTAITTVLNGSNILYTDNLAGVGGAGALVEVTPGVNYTFSLDGVPSDFATRTIRVGTTNGDNDVAESSDILSAAWDGTQTLTFTPTTSTVYVSLAAPSYISTLFNNIYVYPT